MIADLAFVERKFDEFDRKIFNGRLPRIPLLMTDARTYRGICESRIVRNSDGSKTHTDFKIRISRAFDLPEMEIEDVIIHEMIHYFIDYNGLIDSAPHGYLFKSLMVSINNAYGRKIQISHRQPDGSEPPGQSTPTTGKWHVVAVLYFTDGRVGFKVIPRNTRSLTMFRQKIGNVSEVGRLELYLTNNGYFDRYPSSVALRYHSITQEELKNRLEGARELTKGY